MLNNDFNWVWIFDMEKSPNNFCSAYSPNLWMSPKPHPRPWSGLSSLNIHNTCDSGMNWPKSQSWGFVEIKLICADQTDKNWYWATKTFKLFNSWLVFFYTILNSSRNRKWHHAVVSLLLKINPIITTRSMAVVCWCCQQPDRNFLHKCNIVWLMLSN